MWTPPARLRAGSLQVSTDPGWAQPPQPAVSLQTSGQLTEVKFTMLSSYSKKHSKNARNPQATEQGSNLSVKYGLIMALGSNPS